MFVERNNHSAPFCFDNALASPLDSLEKVREPMRSLPYGIAEVAGPHSAGFATIFVERLVGIDRGKCIESNGDLRKARLSRPPLVIQLKDRGRRHISSAHR